VFPTGGDLTLGRDDKNLVFYAKVSEEIADLVQALLDSDRTEARVMTQFEALLDQRPNRGAPICHESHAEKGIQGPALVADLVQGTGGHAMSVSDPCNHPTPAPLGAPRPSAPLAFRHNQHNDTGDQE
jgi:hypothetical protein